jgi:hypothetical protein
VKLDRIYKIFQDLHVNPERSCKSCLSVILVKEPLLVRGFAQRCITIKVGRQPTLQTLTAREVRQDLQDLTGFTC